MAAISIDYGTIQVFDDAVPADLYEEIAQIVPHLTWQWGWHSKNPNARYWHHEIGRSQKDNIEDVTHAVARHRVGAFSRYVEWLRREAVPEDTRLLRLYLNGHTFGTDGSPHTDTERSDELTAVLFLNREWHSEFGGETVVFDQTGDIEKAVMPRWNRLLTFPSDRVHAPRPLSKLFPGLRVVLVAKLGAAEHSNGGFARAT